MISFHASRRVQNFEAFGLSPAVCWRSFHVCSTRWVARKGHAAPVSWLLHVPARLGSDLLFTVYLQCCGEYVSRRQITAVSEKDLRVLDGDGKMTIVVKRAGNARADPTIFRLLAIRSVNTTPGPCVRTLWQHRVKSAPRTF
jgi:hypothetical protein